MLRSSHFDPAQTDRFLTNAGIKMQSRIYCRVMTSQEHPSATPRSVPLPRMWDAKLARRLIMPLVNTRVTPNHLTTVRLLIGLIGALCLARGGYGWVNLGALFIVI